MNGDAFAGGMFQTTEERDEVPLHWMVYVAVDDSFRAISRPSVE